MRPRADSPLEHLVYLSIARPELDAVDVRAILGSAQIRNRRRDVTGILLFTGRHFVQVLEGRSADLEDLLQVILSDARHGGLTIMSRTTISQRRYGAWAMAFIESLDDADAVDELFLDPDIDRARLQGILERAARGL